MRNQPKAGMLGIPVIAIPSPMLATHGAEKRTRRLGDRDQSGRVPLPSDGRPAAAGRAHPRPRPRRAAARAELAVASRRRRHLDGELIIGGGRPVDFYAVVGAVSSRRVDRPTLTFVAFDALWVDGCWLIDEPHQDRRRVLEQLAQLSGGSLPVVTSFPANDLDDVLAACEQLDRTAGSSSPSE